MTTLINLERYPIDHDGPAGDDVLTQIRQDLAKDGCAVLKGFLPPAGIDALIAEANSVADKDFRSFGRTNPYFTQDDPNLPADHPQRAFFVGSNNFIAADNFAPSGALRTIHDHPGFDAFIRDSL